MDKKILEEKILNNIKLINFDYIKSMFFSYIKRLTPKYSEDGTVTFDNSNLNSEQQLFLIQDILRTDELLKSALFWSECLISIQDRHLFSVVLFNSLNEKQQQYIINKHNKNEISERNINNWNKIQSDFSERFIIKELFNVIDIIVIFKHLKKMNISFTTENKEKYFINDSHWEIFLQMNKIKNF